MYPNLNAEIARAGLSRKDIASRLHISDSALSYKMRGKTPFTWDEVLLIQRILPVTGLPIEKLFQKEQKRHEPWR